MACQLCPALLGSELTVLGRGRWPWVVQLAWSQRSAGRPGLPGVRAWNRFFPPERRVRGRRPHQAALRGLQRQQDQEDTTPGFRGGGRSLTQTWATVSF